MAQAHCVWEAGALLGEGPVWSEEEQALYWVDIKEQRILRYRPRKEPEAFPMPEEIGCIALRARGGLVAAFRSGFAFVDLASGAIEKIGDPEAGLAGNRFNDGKCDAAGRFWAGTMDDACEQCTGALYRLDPDLTIHKMDAGYAVSNGPAFSPDGRTLYHNDTMEGVVYAFDCEPQSGEISNKRVLVRIPRDQGLPDGTAVDVEGCLWIAHWNGGRVTRYAPDGRALKKVDLPTPCPTSCAFGGPDLATLYVTTAACGVPEAERARQPVAGGLFAIAPGVAGLPAQRFAG